MQRNKPELDLIWTSKNRLNQLKIKEDIKTLKISFRLKKDINILDDVGVSKLSRHFNSDMN